jgi:hypothetical protein
MSTRAEQKRYADERKHPSQRDEKAARGSRSGEPGKHPNAHAAQKASYALEPRAADGHASRKSTRGSANHQRNDGGKTTAAAIVGRSPEAVHDRAAARNVRSHGQPGPKLKMSIS